MSTSTVQMIPGAVILKTGTFDGLRDLAKSTRFEGEEDSPWRILNFDGKRYNVLVVGERTIHMAFSEKNSFATLVSIDPTYRLTTLKKFNS